MAIIGRIWVATEVLQCQSKGLSGWNCEVGVEEHAFGRYVANECDMFSAFRSESDLCGESYEGAQLIPIPKNPSFGINV